MVIPSSHFTISGRVLVCEASDLGADFTIPMTVQSTRTGKCVEFGKGGKVSVIRDGEGDIVKWVLVNEREKVEVHVYND